MKNYGFKYDRYGYPIELTEGKPIKNFFRLTFLNIKKFFYAIFANFRGW